MRTVAPGVVREKIVVVVPMRDITLSDASRVQGVPGGGFSHGPTLAAQAEAAAFLAKQG